MIGGGTGGYSAAFRAGQLGLKVALVDEQSRLGGTCLLWGCSPTKAMLDSAEFYHRVTKASDYGIKVDNDEGRFCLVVETEYGEDDEMLLQIDIHDDVLSFWENLRSTIGRYAAEAADARATMPQPVTVAVEDVYAAIDAGYALDDPKSPGYHDRMVD